MTFRSLAGSCFLATGTGKRMRDISRDPEHQVLLFQISNTGEQYQVLSPEPDLLNDLKPTSELASHLSIHQYLLQHHPAKKAVVHTHPDDIIALTHLPEGKETESLTRIIWGMHPESVIFLPKGVGFVPYVCTGSNALALATLEALKSHEVILWEKHGCLAVAESPAQAFDLIDIVDKSAGIYLKCKAAGHQPMGLTDDQIMELRNTFQL